MYILIHAPAIQWETDWDQPDRSLIGHIFIIATHIIKTIDMKLNIKLNIQSIQTTYGFLFLFKITRACSHMGFYSERTSLQLLSLVSMTRKASKYRLIKANTSSQKTATKCPEYIDKQASKEPGTSQNHPIETQLTLGAEYLWNNSKI